MAKRKAFKIKPSVSGGIDRQVIVYADEDKLKKFIGTYSYNFNTNFPDVEVEVKAHTRRRYPGGPVQNVNAHNRTMDPNRGYNQSVLPGLPFWLERQPLVGKKIIHQFTFVGSLSDLKDAVRDSRNGEVTLRGPSGDAWDFESAGTGT